jgi:transposase
MSKIKECARAGELELLYFDEAGFSSLPNVQRSWSPLGLPHTADASLGRKRANVMGALDYGQNKLHFDVSDHTITRNNVISFLDHLAQSSAPDKFTFLVMDNASMHHNIDQDITDRWLVNHRFIPLYLPPYSPELNLFEILWKHAKYHWRAFTSWTRDALLGEVQALLDGYGTKFHIGYA